MLTTYSHLKAEDKYRRDTLRDHYRSETRNRLSKVVATLLVAGAAALAACGAVEQTTAVASVQPVNDIAPGWQPNLQLLEQIVGGADEPVPEPGGVTAPDWTPNWGAATSVDREAAKPTHGPR